MPLASQILLSTPRRPSILAAASVVLSTLFLVTWASYGKRSKDKYSALFGDANASARRIRPCDTTYDFDEYDVVIVGGGKLVQASSDSIPHRLDRLTSKQEQRDVSLHRDFPRIPLYGCSCWRLVRGMLTV